MIFLCIFVIFISVRSVPVEHDDNLDNVTSPSDPEQFKTEVLGNNESLHLRVRRGVIRDKAKRWPSPNIPYEIKSKMSKKMQQAIERTMKRFESKTCLQFKKRLTNWDADYVFFQDDEPGCFSYTGRIGGKQIINFDKDGSCKDESTIAHEIMHSLGFLHEHQRMDRDKYIEIDYDNMVLMDGLEHAHDVKKRDSDTMGFPYDLYSVMHYSSYAYSKNNKPVFVPKKSGVGLIKDNNVNSLDIQKINILFNCKNTKKN